MNPGCFIKASWLAPANVYAGTTIRQGGVSKAPYDSLNLANHVGDLPECVEQNRSLLDLPARPAWLKQVHGKQVKQLKSPVQVIEPEADGSITREAGIICAVLTADCLPVLMTNIQGDQVAALHAGWRGLAEGILEQGLRSFANPAEVIVWLGPAIGPDAFEVGSEVREIFVQQHPQAAHAFVEGTAKGKWQADIYELARLRLLSAGADGARISGGSFCTYTDKERFYSFRRDGITGRMASVIWFE